MTLVTVKDSSAKAHYQYINYNGQFIDSLLRRKVSTQSMETRSRHLSILVAENSLINVFNLTILM